MLRGVIGVAQRTEYISRIRELAKEFRTKLVRKSKIKNGWTVYRTV